MTPKGAKAKMDSENEVQALGSEARSSGGQKRSVKDQQGRSSQKKPCPGKDRAQLANPGTPPVQIMFNCRGPRPLYKDSMTSVALLR